MDRNKAAANQRRGRGRYPKRATCVHIDPELIKLADDLVDSIDKADPKYLTGLTMHMVEAMNNYRRYKEANNVES